MFLPWYVNFALECSDRCQSVNLLPKFFRNSKAYMFQDTFKQKLIFCVNGVEVCELTCKTYWKQKIPLFLTFLLAPHDLFDAWRLTNFGRFSAFLLAAKCHLTSVLLLVIKIKECYQKISFTFQIAITRAIFPILTINIDWTAARTPKFYNEYLIHSLYKYINRIF